MTVVKAGGRTRPVQQLPEPAHFWIAYSPRTWRCAATPWTDLARGDISMQKPSFEQGMPELAVDNLDDLFYLPPVAPELANERDRWAASWVESGTPVLVQLGIEDRCRATGPTVVYDLLEVFLSGETEDLLSLPEGSIAAWPLIPGISDHPGSWEDGLPLLARAGVRCVQPVALDLSPVKRRRLAEGRDDSVFDALFHGGREAGGERDFATYAYGYGLQLFMDRPSAGGTPKKRSNRELAAKLALAGELWLRLNRSVALGQGLFRAARGAETASVDLAALVREDNLKVIDWLNDLSQELVVEWVEKGSSELLDTLMARYVEEDEPSADEEE